MPLRVRVVAVVTLLVAAYGSHGCGEAHNDPPGLPVINHDHPSPTCAKQLTSCRTGAFVEASGFVNSIVLLHGHLKTAASADVDLELDSMLYVAFKQARSEVHCVTGDLRFGYDRSYSEIFRWGVELAKSRNLAPDIIAVGEEVAAALEANRPLLPPADQR